MEGGNSIGLIAKHSTKKTDMPLKVQRLFGLATTPPKKRGADNVATKRRRKRSSSTL